MVSHVLSKYGRFSLILLVSTVLFATVIWSESNAPIANAEEVSFGDPSLDAIDDVRKLLDPAQNGSWGHTLNNVNPANQAAGALAMANHYHADATLLPTVKPGVWKKAVNPKIEDYFKNVFLKKRPTLCTNNLAQSHVVIMGNYAAAQGLYTFELDKVAGVLPRERVRARFSFLYVKDEGAAWNTAKILQHHSSVEPEVAVCAADVDANGVVGVTDLLAVIGAWGNCPAALMACCPSDITGDRNINANDLLQVIAKWGPCAP
jgi:hypothetical protein